MTAVHGPDAVVVDEARRVHADVVVLPGTTTPAILRRYRGAVLIVPECARLPRRAWPSRSVAATVGRGVHRRARIACAARMGEMFGAWLSVVPASAPGVSSAHLAELFLYPLTRAERERPGARGRLGAVIGAAAVPVMVIRVGSPARMRIRVVRRAA